jgi:hypothetical protein
VDDIPFVHLEQRGDLDRASDGLSPTAPAHIFVASAEIWALGELRRACERRLVYAVYTPDVTLDMHLFGIDFDAVPIFQVGDPSAAQELARRLVVDPFNVVQEAVNAGVVGPRFGRGSAS